MGSVRELLRSYFIYAVALMLPSLLSLVTIPIVTRSLTQSEYGLVEFVTLAGVLTFAVFSLSVGEGFARFYALARSDFARSLALRTYLLLTLALGTLAACAFLLLLPTIAFFESSATITASFRLAATAVAITGFLSGVAVTVFRWLDRPNMVLVCTAAGGLAYALAILGLHWLDRLNVDSYLWATSLGAIANICGLVLVVRGELRWSDLEWRHVAGKARRLIAYSMPMLISTVLVFLNQYIDRAIVAKYLGASELGGYAIGVKMAGLFLLVLKPLKMALTPYVFAAAKQDSTAKGFVAIYYAYLAGTLVTFPLAYAISPYIWRLFVAPTYQFDQSLIPILMATGFMSSIYLFFIGMSYKRRTGYIPYFALTSLIVNAVASILLAHWWGARGVAVGGAIASAVYGFLWVRKSVQLLRVPYSHYATYGWMALNLAFIGFVCLAAL